MRVVVFCRKYKEEHHPYVQELFDVLYEQEVSTYVYSPYLEVIQDKINFQTMVGEFEDYRDFSVRPVDFIITLGGDGTILQATTIVRDAGIPLLGINLGRLGFLASTEKRHIRWAIEMLVRGQYDIEERSMLALESNEPLFGELTFALNDFTLLKRDTSSMINIHAYVNGAYLNSYWADGLIVSTPTGSTGYSLSCGGPIVFPNSGNFILTPVAPHNLNVRPLVISDASVLSFEVEGRSEHFLCTLDSRVEKITTHHRLAVRRNSFPTRLVQLQDKSFLSTMRGKLAWGVDNRN